MPCPGREEGLMSAGSPTPAQPEQSQGFNSGRGTGRPAIDRSLNQGGGGVPVATSMSKDQFQQESAGLSRSMYEDYKSTFLEHENAMLDYANDKHLIRDSVNRDVGRIKQGIETAEGMTNRQMSRYGTTLTNAQKKARDRSNNVESNLSIAGGANQSRANTSARRDAVRNSMINLGRETMNDSAGKMSQIASQEQGRNQRNSQAQAQHRAGQTQMVGSGIGLGLALLSERSSKKNIKKHSKETAYEDIKSINLKSFDYKEGDDGKQIGLIRDEAPESIQAPDGKHVNMGSWMGNLTGAIQVLTDKVESLEGRA